MLTVIDQFSLRRSFRSTWRGAKSLSALYTYTAARDLLPPPRTARSEPRFRDPRRHPRPPSPGAVGLGPSHRVTLMATTDPPLHFDDTVLRRRLRRSGLTYNVLGDANGDGYNNDAIYVPRYAGPGGDIEL